MIYRPELGRGWVLVGKRADDTVAERIRADVQGEVNYLGLKPALGDVGIVARCNASCRTIG